MHNRACTRIVTRKSSNTQRKELKYSDKKLQIINYDYNYFNVSSKRAMENGTDKNTDRLKM